MSYRYGNRFWARVNIIPCVNECYNSGMKSPSDIPEIRLDKSVIKVTTFEENDRDTAEYWRHASTKERLQHIERLRRLNYGVRATARLQRVLRVVESPRG